MRITPLLLCFAVVTALAGCVGFERKIEFSGERIKVTFESKEAAKLFYEAYELYRPYHGDHTFVLALPLVVGSKLVVHDTEAWNYYVTKADLDHNSVITVEEVQFLRSTALIGRVEEPAKETTPDD